MESVAKVFKEEKETLHCVGKKIKKISWWEEREEWYRERGEIEEEWGATFFLGSHLNDQQ